MNIFVSKLQSSPKVNMPNKILPIKISLKAAKEIALTELN